MDLPDKELTQKISACAYRVHNVPGAGVLVKVYETAMAVEMDRQGLKAISVTECTISLVFSPVFGVATTVA
jgi:GxxExxY protein